MSLDIKTCPFAQEPAHGSFSSAQKNCHADCALAMATPSGMTCAVTQAARTLSRIADAIDALPHGTNYAVHPCGYLDEWMEATGHTAKDVARETGYPVSEVEAFLKSERVPDTDAARALAKLTGIPTTAWSRYTAMYWADSARNGLKYATEFMSHDGKEASDD